MKNRSIPNPNTIRKVGPDCLPVPAVNIIFRNTWRSRRQSASTRVWNFEMSSGTCWYFSSWSCTSEIFSNAFTIRSSHELSANSRATIRRTPTDSSIENSLAMPWEKYPTTPEDHASGHANHRNPLWVTQSNLSGNANYEEHEKNGNAAYTRTNRGPLRQNVQSPSRA